jgi:hypothetical protein
MIKTTLVLSLMASAMALGACATNEPAAATEQVSQREYPTGSNIPRKRDAGATDGVQTYDKEALERARNEIPQTPRGGLGTSR